MCEGWGVAEEHPDDARERFEALAAEVVEPVRRFLARRTDPDTADDVLAETLLVCWRRLDDVPDNALPWVYGVARNCLANVQRGDRRQVRLAARITVVDPPRETEREADGPDERVTAALAALRPDEADLLRLWAWEQLGPAEIAEVLGITPNAASIRLHRARGKFVEELRKIDGGAGHEEAREGRGR
jgi:RNA polymerase sigma-70 factor (ECF subfamily)